MSRIGKQPVAVPDQVKVQINGREVVVESGSHRLSFTYRPEVSVEHDTDRKMLIVQRSDNSRTAKALHGLTRSLLANMVEGVTKQFSKELEINGVGWTAKLQGNKVALNVGYADTRELLVPDGVEVQIKGNRIKVLGPDKQKVGQLAADIRRQRPPEPYNGKGIKYSDEQIVRKQGKAFASSGA